MREAPPTYAEQHKTIAIAASLLILLLIGVLIGQSIGSLGAHAAILALEHLAPA